MRVLVRYLHLVIGAGCVSTCWHMRLERDVRMFKTCYAHGMAIRSAIGNPGRGLGMPISYCAYRVRYPVSWHAVRVPLLLPMCPTDGPMARKARPRGDSPASYIGTASVQHAPSSHHHSPYDNFVTQLSTTACRGPVALAALQLSQTLVSAVRSRSRSRAALSLSSVHSRCVTAGVY